jgi:hypothetical protein
MRFLERRYKSTPEERERGRRIALHNGLPKIQRDLPSGTHTYERRFTVKRVVGYKTVYDNINTHKTISGEKKALERRCQELGIIPVFKGDYISLASFPRRNIIQEEIIGEVFRNGVKTLEKKSYFDILDYITLK